MREIKFRAKQINDNNWISGYGVIIGDGFCAIPYAIRGNTHDWELTTITCDINTLSQYTGLKDKNGKEIYEGDVIKHSYWERAPLDMYQQGEKDEWIEEYSVVKWDSDDCKFYTIKFDVNIWSCEDYEVIGNIHDNPELIKEEEK